MFYSANALSRAVHTIRTALSDEFAARAERALQKWPVAVTEVEIGGIACQVIESVEQRSGATLLHIFGGGYVSGSPESEQPITAALAALTGFRIVVPRYSLAPEHPFPIGFEQCCDVYAQLAAESTGEPFFLSGESAGGGMAMSLTRWAIEHDMRIPDRLVLFSPWSDLTEDGIAKSDGVDDPTITIEDLRVCAEAYLGTTDPSDVRISPALASYPETWPATLLTTGSRDILQQSVRRIAEDLRIANCPVDLIDADGMYHVFEIYDEFAEGAASLEAVADFLRADE